MMILMQGGIVRTTVTLSDDLIANAQELTGITERTELLRAGLETLVRVESARRLAALGGSDRTASAAPRRRSASQLSLSTPRYGSITSTTRTQYS